MADSLGRYNEKRNFERTPEPGGKRAESNHEPVFVIQKHAATALHYDVRLEVDGVMASWAVPRGPSYDPKVKRLAVHVEDHPLDYRTFEGVIPKSEYGGGRVIVWDEGTYSNASELDGKELNLREAIDKGHVSVEFKGSKMHGGWTLLRTGEPKPDGKENWLMIKRRDSFADASRDITTAEPNSVRSGKSIEEIDEEEADKWTRKSGLLQANGSKSERSTFVEPMLADASKPVPTGNNWVYERKLDGLRCVVVRNGRDVELWSRNHKSFNTRFPGIVDEVRNLPLDNFVLDGEIVAFDGEKTSFSALQRSQKGSVAELWLFDVIRLFGKDVTVLPLRQRRKLLEQAIPESKLIAVVIQETGDATELLEGACSQGWEGLVAKRVESKYEPGQRNDNWRKLKCSTSQEMVIGGWTEPKGTRKGFGALLLGYYENGDLCYAGKVGTGFDAKLLDDLHDELQSRGRATSPFSDHAPEKNTHWVRPDLVAEIRFSEWTSDGHLRHPSFLGLRSDKSAIDVVREARS